MLTKFGTRFRKLKDTLRSRAKPDFLDSYVQALPSPQNSIDIFKGEWASKFPPPFDELKAGRAPLFADPRIQWQTKEIGGFADKSVLDLGPLEGGHAYMFETLGAREIVSIEGNTRAFLKCLITKELLGLKRVSYHCGDFVEYLRNNQRRFDVVNASGVLYHQKNPIEFLSLVSKCADVVLMWTHYYDHEIISRTPRRAMRFSPGQPAEHHGFNYTLFKQDYLDAAKAPGYCGGNARYSSWLGRDDLLGALHHLGFSNVRVAFEEPEHQNGPALALVALR